MGTNMTEVELTISLKAGRTRIDFQTEPGDMLLRGDVAALAQRITELTELVGDPNEDVFAYKENPPEELLAEEPVWATALENKEPAISPDLVYKRRDLERELDNEPEIKIETSDDDENYDDDDDEEAFIPSGQTVGRVRPKRDKVLKKFLEVD